MFSGARQPQHARTAVRLLPREEEFFDLFVEVATRSTVAAQHLRELFDAPPDRRIAHVEAIKRLEHEADQVTHEVVNRLDRTFITPLDREDILELASDLDDVMDAIDGTARRSQILDRKSTRLNSSHGYISYAVFCLKKKKKHTS